MKFALIFLLTLAALNNAKAVLAPPGCASTQVGRQQFNTTTNTMQVCDGTNWIDMDLGALPATCTPAQLGTQRYAGEMQFCDGSHWHSMNVCPTMTATCSKAGVQQWTSGQRMLYCDGANWNIMFGSCTSNFTCSEYTDSASCTGASCAWNGSSCADAGAGCSIYTNSGTCNSDPNCVWSFGVCNSAI